ncbi:SHOCT domain-containing protein [Sinomonas sp.]|uniref:SHOCT domain-containing protein n=1 Tax=Sinomonas sp. TaxID=1914986 RepID=UPI002FE3AFD4
MLVPVAVALAVLLAAALVRAWCRRAVAAALARCRRGARSEARQVLDERYARGELGTEDYLERVRTLGEWM